MTPVDLNQAFCCEEEAETFVVHSSPPKLPLLQHDEDDSEEEENEERQEDQTREDLESIELARRLMEEEAMASYQSSYHLLMRQSNDPSSGLSPEDLAAMEAALREDINGSDAEVAAIFGAEDGDGSNEETDVSYDTLLQLGERIGDVKTERWSLRAKQEIAKLPVFAFKESSTDSNSDAASSDEDVKDDSELKCLVCQCEYEGGDQLCRLPCKHCFHAECVQQWLSTKDFCPYCRQSIV